MQQDNKLAKVLYQVSKMLVALLEEAYSFKPWRSDAEWIKKVTK